MPDPIKSEKIPEPKPPIDSVLDDIGPASYKKPTPPSTGFKLWNGNNWMVRFILSIAVVTAVVVGAWKFFQKTLPPSIEPYISDGQVYYVVKADDPTRDTGTKTCNLYGLKCAGFTNLKLDACLAYHPDAKKVTDSNGSKAGFYCNGGARQGVCANEKNTCHICPNCNVNADCDTKIGDNYQEMYVECLQYKF